MILEGTNMAEFVDKMNAGYRIVLKTLAPFVAQELKKQYKDDWWQKGVLTTLSEAQCRDLPKNGNWPELVDSLDILRCLQLIDYNWSGVFRLRMSIDHRNWVKELIGVRNKVAHIGSQDFDSDYAWRALDTMARLLEHIDAEATEEIRTIARQIRYGTDQASTTLLGGITFHSGAAKSALRGGVLSAVPTATLRPWRDVISPHPDVAKGQYKNAEFAADLNQVAKGGGSIEYRDPVEFFARTYLTEGLKNLLVQSLRRVSSKDGDPVIQLKTVFGGGKTHSMLALYHMLRGQVSLSSIEETIRPVLNQAGLQTLVKANVAVIVGTALDPSKSRRPAKFPGITINTLWGEIGAQLAESAGDSSLYDYVKESDRKGTSPGSETFRQLFDACGPCVVLMDELVAYAKKLQGRNDLPAGTFDNLITFIQELTEGARASKNSLVVASIPESDLEIGGEAGQKALETIEHTFGRMEAIWKPVASNEGFEIVRRRLFLKPQDPDALEATCRAFSEMYVANESDFPSECREVEYYERIKACYPIHPEVFDRLYEDWGTLERFQKTRGVLRLMAAVIHELWMESDNGLMIMPGSFTLDVPAIRDELTRHLSEGWNAVIEYEVDGQTSTPFQIDRGNPRFSKCLAARRVSRTIMIGSAPTVREQHVRGIESVRILLGVVQPGESIPVFNDVLSQLQNKLAYLYSDTANSRYWFDTRPTLRKTVEDRATQISAMEVEHEVESRLKSRFDKSDFVGIHICPTNSLNIPDEQSVRLVILSPEYTHKAGNETSKARVCAEDYLFNRGTAPRIYRNMLVFAAADNDLLQNALSEVRMYLAWKSVVDDSEVLNLDHVQQKQANANCEQSDTTVKARLAEAYSWLLVPTQFGTSLLEWSFERIPGSAESIAKKAFSRMLQQEHIIRQWNPLLLKKELDELLWKDTDCISIRELWKMFTSYCYLPRLRDGKVLLSTIESGLRTAEYFAYADGNQEGRYSGLRVAETVYADETAYLVKLDIAKQQLKRERAEHDGLMKPSPDNAYNPAGTGGNDSYVGETTLPVLPIGERPVEPLNSCMKTMKRFHATARLNPDRVGSEAGKINEELIQHLSLLKGADVEINLEISVKTMTGIPVEVIRTVKENARTLKIEDAVFEEE